MFHAVFRCRFYRLTRRKNPALASVSQTWCLGCLVSGWRHPGIYPQSLLGREAFRSMAVELRLSTFPRDRKGVKTWTIVKVVPLKKKTSVSGWNLLGLLPPYEYYGLTYEINNQWKKRPEPSGTLITQGAPTRTAPKFKISARNSWDLRNYWRWTKKLSKETTTGWAGWPIPKKRHLKWVFTNLQRLTNLEK